MSLQEEALVSRVTIYSKDGCVWCDRAASLCKAKGINYTVLKLGVDYEVEDFNSHFPYATTVPQIYVDGKHVGGYDDLVNVV
jgi:glutaredoxin